MDGYRCADEFREVTDRVFGRRVRVGGDLALALKLVPLTQPLGPRYRKLLATEYPHLLI